MDYGYGRKKVFRRSGERSLAAKCLADGTLDVCLSTGEVIGKYHPMKLRCDEDGYMIFDLERQSRTSGRRKRQKVRVHRLVLIKKLAVETANDLSTSQGRTWRECVRDLPQGMDVDHLDRNRQNNAASNLCLKVESANRAKREMTEEEQQDVNVFLEEAF